MTIDETITHEKELAEKDYLQGMLCHANPNDEELDGYIEHGRYHEQLVEWLEDYKHIKQWKSDIMDDFCKYDVSSFEELIANTRNKAIDDFVNACKDNTVCQTFGLRQCDIEKIAEQLKGGE